MFVHQVYLKGISILLGCRQSDCQSFHHESSCIFMNVSLEKLLTAGYFSAAQFDTPTPLSIYFILQHHYNQYFHVNLHLKLLFGKYLLVLTLY